MGKPKLRGIAVELQAPLGLVAHSLVLGAEEFVLLEFAVPGHPRALGSQTDLAPSEHAVLELMLDGRSNKQIALARQTSPNTVANQVAAIFRKLDVGSRRELFALNRASEGT